MTRWRVAPILGFRDVRKAAEYYRDVLGFNEQTVLDGVGEEGPPYGLRDFTIQDLEGHRLVFGTPLDA